MLSLSYTIISGPISVIFDSFVCSYTNNLLFFINLFNKDTDPLPTMCQEVL